MRLSLVGFSLDHPEIQHIGNDGECNDYLKTVEKFIKTCHRFADGL